MRDAARSLYELARLNGRLLDNALDGVSERLGRRRLNGRINNMAFVALHLLDARCYLGRYLGLEVEHPFGDLAAGVESIEQMTDFPPLAAIRRSWHELAPQVAERIPELKGERWREPSNVDFPIADRTLFGGTSFLLHHESYHIGQLALLRKYFGLGATRYA
ncbi:MAG: hypothetical protein D6696_16445 [Acidobacteria bacterium]|nr:MAG: hypothetical protein D6696_16445 [Acidobacteriota bacterium]